MEGLEIRINKIDWKNILELALNKKDWGKKFVLFNYKKTIVTAEIVYFNFRKNKAEFEINFDYENTSISNWDKMKSISYYLDNFTLDDFKKLINRSILSSLTKITYEESINKGYKELGLKKYFGWDITAEQLKNRYGKEYMNLVKLDATSSMNFYGRAIQEMKLSLAEELNKPIIEKVTEYAKKNPLIIDGFEQLKENLKEEED